MNIGFDARLLGPLKGGGGIGRYVASLQTGFVQRSNPHTWTWYVGATSGLPLPHHREISTSIPTYSLREQWQMGPLMNRGHHDLIHVPHWNVSWRLKTPYVVTIHDLIPLEMGFQKEASQHPLPLAYLKWHAMRLVIGRVVKKARAIMTVSQASKASLLRFFPELNEAQIHVIPLAVPTPLFGAPKLIEEPYLLYVGNTYPHKNLDFLLRTWVSMKQKHDHVMVIAGRDDAFFRSLRVRHSDPSIRFIPSPSDESLASFYTHATAVVCPSLIEGFGLPPLEALSYGTPVIASHIKAFQETVGNLAFFFNPHEPENLAQTLQEVLQNPQAARILASRAKNALNYYRWDRVVDDTLYVYNSC